MGSEPAASIPDEVLEAFGCADADITQLPNGQVNTAWKLVCEERTIVLRRSHISRAVAAVEWEQELVRFCDERRWPVPVSVLAVSGETVISHDGAVWSAAKFLDGSHPPADRVSMQRIYGRLLARLHRTMADFPLEGQRPAAGKLWELDVWVAPAEAGSFNDLLADFGREHADLAWAIRRYRYRNLRELSRLHYPDLPDLPIHGDFDASNLLWADGGVSGVLDFDWCRRDALACDLAASLPWDDMSADRIRGLLEGYGERRPLDDAEWELLPALTRAHLLFFIAFRLVEWKMLGGERPAHSIGRTVRERLPRTDGLAATLGELRGTIAAR